MKEYIKLLRVKSYVKNFLIYIPYVFSGIYTTLGLELKKIILAFFAMSFTCSFVYIINDINDCKKDQLHSKKKNRPIASGKISIKKALSIAIIFLMLGVVCGYFINTESIYVLLGYVFLNLLYSFKLKQVPIIDLLCLSLCFLARIILGGVVFSVPISGWLYLTTLSAAFYFGVGKRRNELKKESDDTRDVLKYYPIEYLTNLLNMFLGMTAIYYSLWIINGDFSVYMNINCLYVSIIELIIILLKYQLDLYSEKYGETPVEIFFKDKIIFLGAVVFVITITISIISA